MRTIENTGQFKRDFKRESKGRHKQVLGELLMEALALLRADAPLPAHYHDHPLTGNWDDHRDCHLKPDLLLIYRKPDASPADESHWTGWCRWVSLRGVKLNFHQLLEFALVLR